MSSRATTARQLIERSGDHPVITLNFDLDPEEFATAPARASQARALIDEAHRLAEGDDEPWCAALVTSRTGEVYRGTGSQVTARQTIEDCVRGHGQGDASGEHAQEQDMEAHLGVLAELTETTRAVTGVADTLEALNERRVKTLLLSRVQAALLQDAAVIAYDEPQDALPPARPIAALLRF